MDSQSLKKIEKNYINEKDEFYLNSSKKLISFFNNTINNRNPSIDLIMSSPTGCMIITEVMKNFYLKKDLSKQDLVTKTVNGVSLNMNQSSVYKMVDKAIEQGIFTMYLKKDDKRVRLITPSEKTIKDMEKWFDEIKLV